MKKCTFTIVAKNYIGLAQILQKSVLRVNGDIDFFIFVADELPRGLGVEDNVLVAREVLDIASDVWTDMSFKYDLTEFCTSIKPACFEYVFARGYEKAVYFDPDIFVFSSLNKIYDILDGYVMALTPQIAGVHVDYISEHPEWAMNVNGIFNLGFCAMRKCDRIANIIAWWKKRLIDNAFADRSVGNFTDQKWMDWMPGLLGTDGLYVFHDLGMNMAPWNFFERELVQENGDVCVRFRTEDCRDGKIWPLVFIHFAGYDYAKLRNGEVCRKRIRNLREYEDLQLATDVYCKAIVADRNVFDRFIDERYSYGSFPDGTVISSFHRRLYHGLVTNEGMKFSNPFSTGKGSFYELLRKRKMLAVENPDAVNRNNIGNLGRKRRAIGVLFSMLYSMMGYKRYVLFVKSLYDYCRPEWHGFLIRRK